MAGFFRRVKNGENPGYPRFRSWRRWRAFGFSEFRGIRFDDGRLRFKGLPGGLRVHLHRPLPEDGVIYGCVFRRDHKGWYVCFQVALPVMARRTGPEVGIASCLNVFASLSNGEAIPDLRNGCKAQRELRRRRRALIRCKKGSKRREKVRAQLDRASAKVGNARRTFLHQQSAKITRDYALIAVKDLRLQKTVKSSHAGSIDVASWGTFVKMLSYKAARAGGEVIKVDAIGTSEACPKCGRIVPKELGVRMHRCDCVSVLDHNHNAALDILHRAVPGPGRLNA